MTMATRMSRPPCRAMGKTGEFGIRPKSSSTGNANLSGPANDGPNLPLQFAMGRRSAARQLNRLLQVQSRVRARQKRNRVVKALRKPVLVFVRGDAHSKLAERAQIAVKTAQVNLEKFGQIGPRLRPVP